MVQKLQTLKEDSQYELRQKDLRQEERVRDLHSKFDAEVSDEKTRYEALEVEVEAVKTALDRKVESMAVAQETELEALVAIQDKKIATELKRRAALVPRARRSSTNVGQQTNANGRPPIRRGDTHRGSQGRRPVRACQGARKVPALPAGSFTVESPGTAPCPRGV